MEAMKYNNKMSISEALGNIRTRTSSMPLSFLHVSSLLRNPDSSPEGTTWNFVIPLLKIFPL